MKRGLPVVLVFALLLGLSSQAFGAAKIGSSCSKVSSFQQSGKTLLVCDLVKKKKVWRKASNIEVRLYNQERIRLAKEATAKALEESRAAADKAADKAAADKAAADKAAADKAAANKKTTITCVKGKLTKKVTAVKPKCPTGYKVKR